MSGLARYRDRDERDDDLLKRMLVCVEAAQIPKGFRKQPLKDAVSTIRQYLRRHGMRGDRRRAKTGNSGATASWK